MKDKVDLLVEDNDGVFPSFPSAQIWRNMTRKEKDKLQKLVSKTVDYEDWENEMFKHHPVKKENKLKYGVSHR